MARLTSALAFMQRASQRAVGLRRSYGYLEQVGPRAARYLPLLRAPAGSLRHRLALENLRSECDLWDEEAALVPEALELQVKIIEFANTEPAAAEILHDMLEVSLMSMAFTALLQQARKEGVDSIRIDLTDQSSILPVSFRIGDWREEGTFPANLADPLRGVVARLERIGYPRMKELMKPAEELPEQITVRWPGPSILEIALGSNSP